MFEASQTECRIFNAINYENELFQLQECLYTLSKSSARIQPAAHMSTPTP